MGLVLGDLQTGLAVGASLELLFMGSVSIGAYVPPNETIGGVLACAFAIQLGQGTETAIALAMPIAVLSLTIGNITSALFTVFVDMADRFALKGNLKGIMAVGIGSMVYVGTDMLGVAIIGQAINGLAWGFLEPLQMILIQERADIKYLGRITGFVRFGLMSAGVVPLLAAPFLAEALGVQTVLFGASTIIALVGTLFFVTQGRRRGR